MFLRHCKRHKDGKEHRYWSVVENRRAGKRVVQRQVLCHGEVNDSQREAWQKAISVFDEDTRQDQQMVLHPAERELPCHAAGYGVRVRMDQIRLRHPRRWGDCWLALHLVEELELEGFWRERLDKSREGTDWVKVLQVLTVHRLLDPGSEWRLPRDWFDQTALADLLGGDVALAAQDTLYRCHDRLLPHKEALFSHLAKRLWLMDRGIPTEKVLAEMRASDPPGQYLVGTPKGRLTRLEGRLHEQPWKQAREGVKVKLLEEEGETYVLARSRDRAGKERGMRQRRLRQYLSTLHRLRLDRKRPPTRDQLLQALGDLGLRPIWHQLESRIEAHVFISFQAYCLQVTLRARFKALAPGLTPRAVFERLSNVQMLDVEFPTTDGRVLTLPRHTEPDPEVALLLERLKLSIPPQPKPRITTSQKIEMQWRPLPPTPGNCWEISGVWG